MWSANSEKSKKEDLGGFSSGSGKNQLENSSCIDSGFLSGPQSAFDDESAEIKEHKPQNVPPPPKISLQTEKQSKQVEIDDHLDSGYIDVDTETKTEEMRLNNKVDSGLSEWFCNLNLQTNEQVNNLSAPGSGQTTKVEKSSKNIKEESMWEIYYQQNDEGDTQLHLACITGYTDVVAALIRMSPHPCLFDIQNDEAQTSLHLAVLTGQPKIVRMLLVSGAEPIVRDRHGNTPLHLACIAGDLQCVKALTIPFGASEIQEAHRQYGHRSLDKTTSSLKFANLPADLEIRNYEGERCVHLAAQGGHIEILRHLVSFGADINAREGKSGRTPLHMAIECCNEILANFLLDDTKLNIETATYAGLTAYQVACILNNSAMQNNLESRGAKPLTPPESDYYSDNEYDSENDYDLDESQIYDRFGDLGFFVNFSGAQTINVA